MKKIVSALLLSCALAGCVAIRSYNDAAALRGKPIAAAIERYGPPTERKADGNRETYVWREKQADDWCELIINVNQDGLITDQLFNGGGGGLKACNRLFATRHN